MTFPKYNTNIDIVDGLFVGNNHSIDARFVVETYADLASIVSNNKAYNGLRTYVDNEDQYYEYRGGAWEAEFPTVNAVPDSSLDFATGKTVIYFADADPNNNVAYICVGGATGAKVWKAITT